MTLTVRDDGTGLTDPGAGRGRATAQGSGLHGMSERLSAVGGTLQLRPDLRPGFSLIATVQATPQAAAAAPEVTSSTV